MDGQQILHLYRWQQGICFRHPSRGQVPTAHVETIRPAAGGVQDVRACADCVLDMERSRKAAAEREGRPYSPGRLGGEGESE